VAAQKSLIDQLVRPGRPDAPRARELIKSNLALDPTTADAAARSLRTLFESTWKASPAEAKLTLAALEQVAPGAPRNLALAARLGRSDALDATAREAQLADVHDRIVAHLEATVVNSQSGLVNPGLGEIRDMLSEYRESAAAAGGAAFDRLMTKI